MAHHNLDMPVTEAQVRALRVNDTVTLQRTLYGIRDATQIHMFDRGRTTRFDLNGHAVIHTAPTGLPHRRVINTPAELSAAVNLLGVGPQGLGGDATAFAVHVELAATHITMNPVAVNMQCHSARRARASFTPAGVSYGF